MTSLEMIKDVVNRKNFVVLDTETTGLYNAECVEIAIIDHEGNTLLNQRIKPYAGIPSAASNVHGIYIEDLEDCPTFDQVAEQITKHLLNKDVVVYNASYDKGILYSSAKHAKMERVQWSIIADWYCAMEAFSPIYGEWNDYHHNYKWQKLTTAARFYNVNVENAHAALGDCLMTLGVIKAMAK